MVGVPVFVLSGAASLMTSVRLKDAADEILWRLQALLNNSYLYHMAHGKDFESRGIESKTPHRPRTTLDFGVP